MCVYQIMNECFFFLISIKVQQYKAVKSAYHGHLQLNHVICEEIPVTQHKKAKIK